MARYLAIDWNQNQISVVSANVSRSGVRVINAIVFPEPSILGGPDVEAAGHRLRENLKAAKIAPAPVIACLGRERLVVKDLRYPAGIPDNEEPGVVRFQALKELSSTPDEVIVDYVRVGDTGAERRALILAAKREQVAGLQALCNAAGLKLAGISARAIGLGACLERSLGTSVLTPAPDPIDSPVAIVALGEGWGEFCVSRKGVPLLSRSVIPGPALPSELRRNLMVYSGQAAGQGVKAVYVVGGPESAVLRERLRQSLEMPVHLIDPFGGSEQPGLPVAEKRGAFVGLMGLLQLQGERTGLPINFLKPKEPTPVADPNKRRGLLGVGLVAALLVAVGVLGWFELSRIQRQVSAQGSLNMDLDKALLVYEDDSKRMDALKRWKDHNVVVLDVLYDFADYFPDPQENRMRLSSMTFDVVERPPASKDPHVAKISLKGVVGDDYGPADLFHDRLAKDGHYRVDALKRGRNSGPDVRNGFTQQFELLRIDVQNRPPDKYVRRIEEDEAAAPKSRGNRGRGR